MPRAGFFRGMLAAYALPAYCLKVANRAEHCNDVAININELRVTSPERSYFTRVCTMCWESKTDVELAALLYVMMYRGNGDRHPRNDDEARPGSTLFFAMGKV